MISKLIGDSSKFIKDDFTIDFTHEMETLPEMTIFEKCLVRLYHRFYTAERAIAKSENNTEDKVLVVDRSIYDSLVYIEVEHKLGELTDEQYDKLMNIVNNGIEMIKPYTVVLNPYPEEVVRRLDIRHKQGTRKKRDELCAREDNVEYVGLMTEVFKKISHDENIFCIHNNEDEDIKEIYQWVDKAVLA